jgi:hypothetical protein
MIKHRYVVRGCPVPVIFPGTLQELELALVHALKISQYLPDKPVTVWFDRWQDGTNERHVIRTYQAGRELVPEEEAEEE